jgi:2'-5' RNA ligase
VDGTVRVGVAIDIPQPWGRELDLARARSGDPMAPFIPAHVTVLGPTDLPSTALPDLVAHLRTVATRQDPFLVRLAGTDTFRPVTEVVYVAVSTGLDQLHELSGAVRSGPLDVRLAFPYHPHVTIAHDVAAAALDAAQAELADFTAEWVIDQFTFYVHGDDGHWHPLESFPLGLAARLAPDDDSAPVTGG